MWRERECQDIRERSVVADFQRSRGAIDPKVTGLCPQGGQLVDFYDGGDHLHVWGLRFRKDEHIWGLRF